MPRVSRATLALSKANWQRKRKFRADRWRYWRNRPKQNAGTIELRRKWYTKLQEADRVLERVNASFQKTAPVLGKRDEAIAFGRRYIGVHESPAGSNRGPLIDQWQRRFGFLGAPWCGIFLGNELLAAGVHGVTSRIASVDAIEDDARAHRGCFFGYTVGYGSHAQRGDAVILFGRGVHVEIIVDVVPGGYRTIGGNTSATTAGNQSAGGCVAPHTRSAGEVHGVAHVRY